ncbi:SGNH/GDSL hydrolase family protein [Hymenobacter aerilatus]|uniref:SGNH/GDSL hydrolase family protein n=1 Tax=Hymenobacter aerilatus TaxID=2932251 RepID=A0A8T9SR17_9BACT|nr:SGNH/GDSL hydrolase family protein [Hymenobacter aerilatus]UOR03801.1 SGNH/GDSL hydrolase family protein [Hymenobacter aerilatus]
MSTRQSATALLPLDSLKLVYMGSSVPTGVGATNQHGYTALYSDLLAQRAAAGAGLPWQTANISISGNNTIAVMKRFDADLLPQRAKYVVFALALGNEGIKEKGQPVFEQFKTNLVALINRARAHGMVPIITNGYTRNDYGPEQYAFTKQMNLLIQGWNVPSINLLGAVDDGQGRWTTGYWSDALHPNDRGHAEMAHTMVPSLFDALHVGKPLPTRRVSQGIRLINTASRPAPTLRLVPEDVVHPFTTIIRFKTGTAGQLLAIQDSAGLITGALRVTPSGVVAYTSTKGQRITGKVPVANNRWHQLALTHYYARGTTQLYVDSTQEGSVAERLRPTQFNLGGAATPRRVQLRDWFFYRSGMNQDEILAVAADSLLKSSLEFYAPLHGHSATSDSLQNLAQSMNMLRVVQASQKMQRTKRSGTATRSATSPPAITPTSTKRRK